MEQSLEILDSDFVVRRIYREHLRSDGSLQSNSFSDRQDTPSCHLEKLTSIQAVGKMKGVVCLVRLNIGRIRELGLDVLHDPTPEDFSHCIIVKTPDCATSKDKMIRRKLVAISEICYLD